MSLVGHYTLNNEKDLVHNNHGTLLGTASIVDGKIGQCLDVTRGTNNHLEVPHDGYISERIFGRTATLSFSFWLKVRELSNYGAVVNKATSGSWSNTTTGVWVHSGGVRFVLGTNQGGNPSNSSADVEYTPNLNEWVHYACVADDTTKEMKMYINGVHHETASFANLTERSENTNPIIIGGGRVGGYNEGINGQIDDLRIYDHALSEREVKDLSKGLALHYSFDRKAHYTENVVTNTNLDTGWSKGYATNIIFDEIDPPAGVESPTVGFEDDAGGGTCYWYSYGDYAPQEPGKTYAISIWMKVEGTGDVGINAYLANNSEIGRQRTETRYVNQTDGWVRVEWDALETPTDSESDSLSFQFPSMGAQRVWLCAPQMELNHHTDFVDGIREDFVSDNSGNGAKGQLGPVSPKWVNDPDIGGVYEFNGKDAEIVVPNSPNVLGDTSIAFWIYPKNGSKRQTLWNNGYAGEGTINFEGSSDNFLRFYSGPNGGNTSGYESIGSTTLNLNQWTHAVAIRDMATQTFKWYLNGELDTTTSFSFTSVGESLSNLQIGNGYTDNFEGSLADVRQYTTVLSADEVKTLYQTGLAVDDHHRMHGKSISERPINSVPPLSRWDLPSDAEIISDNEVILNSGQASSPIFSVSEPDRGYYHAEVYSEVDAPGYTDAGFFMGTNYYNNAGDSVESSTGWTGNGHARRFTKGEWYRHIWVFAMGSGITQHRIRFGGSSYTGYPIKVRNVAWAPFELPADAEHQWSTEVITDTEYKNPEITRKGADHYMMSEVGITLNMAAWYPLIHDAKDRVSNQVATVNGATPAGDGYEFDGSGTTDGTVAGDHIDIPESLTNTSNYPDGCTYSFWINVDTDAVDRMSLFFGNTTINHIEIRSIERNFRTEAAMQNGYSFSGGTFPDSVRGVWSHFAIVFANAEAGRPVRWYQNGELFHTGSMDDGNNPGDEYFSFNKIGRSTGTTSYTYAKSFDGKFKGMKIFGAALTPEEVAQEYSASSKAMINNSTAFAKEFIEV